MNCKFLKDLLSTLHDDAEVAIEVLNIVSNDQIALSYDIGVELSNCNVKLSAFIEQ